MFGASPPTSGGRTNPVPPQTDTTAADALEKVRQGVMKQYPVDHTARYP